MCARIDTVIHSLEGERTHGYFSRDLRAAR